MDSPGNSSEAQLTPSINDIIDWHVDQSINSGRLGYSTNFPTGGFFDVDPGSSAAETEPFDSEDVSVIMETALKDYIAEHDRAIDHAKYMNTHPELLVEAENEVNRRLAQAGRTQQTIDGYASGEGILRRKIEDLYKLENAGPGKTNAVAATLYYRPPGVRHSADINLHIHGSLAELKSSAKTYLDCIREPGEPLETIYDEDARWKYKWKPKDKAVKVKEEWFPLESERDYKILIHQATSASREPFNIVLMQELRPAPANAKKDTQAAIDIQEDQHQDQDEFPPPMPSDMHYFFDDDFDLDRDLEACDVEGSMGGKYEAEFEQLADAYKASKEREASRALNDQKRVDHDAARQAQPKTKAAEVIPVDKTIIRGGRDHQRSQKSKAKSSITPFFPSKKSPS